MPAGRPWFPRHVQPSPAQQPSTTTASTSMAFVYQADWQRAVPIRVSPSTMSSPIGRPIDIALQLSIVPPLKSPSKARRGLDTPPHPTHGCAHPAQGGVQFLITFGTISYHLYSAVFCSVFCCILKNFEIRCILPYFESVEFGQI